MADDVKYWEDLKKEALANNLTSVRSLIVQDFSRTERSLKLIAYCGAQNGHLAIFQYAVEEEPSILTSEYEKGQTVAHVAAMNGHLNILTFIAEQNPLALALEDHLWETPLYLALKKGIIKNLNMLKFFVEEKSVPLTNLENIAYVSAAEGKIRILQYIVSVNATVLNVKRNNRNLAQIAAINGHPNIIRYLGQNAPTLITSKDYLGHNLLYMMVEHNSNDMRIFQYLEKLNVSWRHENKREKDAVYLVAQNGNLKLLKYIEEKDPSVLETRYYWEETIAHIAANYNNWNMVRYIVEKRPDLLAIRDRFSITILHIAARSEDINKSTWKFLLRGFDLSSLVNETANFRGQTFAEIALRRCNIPFILDVAERMPSLFVPREWGDHACIELEWCILGTNNLQTLKRFIEICEPVVESRGLKPPEDIYRKIPYLMTKNLPLKLARRVLDVEIRCVYYSLLVVKYFIEVRKFDVNILDEKDEPLIFTAVRSGRRCMIEYLAAQNANLTLVNANRENILYIAIEEHDLSTVKYVLENRTAAIDLEWRNKLANTVLHTAVLGVLNTVRVCPVKMSEAVNILEYLVEQKHVNVNARGHEGKTCLHRAALHSHVKICHYLRQWGADPEIRDDLGRTYWDYATFNRSRRNRRSVHRPPSYSPSILHSFSREPILPRLGANSFHIDGVDSSVYNQLQIPTQFQNFLTICNWVLRKTKRSWNMGYMLSPVAVVQNKISADAVNAVDMNF